MGIDLTKFAIDNLIDGYREKSFSRVQISIFSMNYMMRGILTNDDITYINEQLDKIDEEWEQERLEQEQLEKEQAELEGLEQDSDTPLDSEE